MWPTHALIHHHKRMMEDDADVQLLEASRGFPCRKGSVEQMHHFHKIRSFKFISLCPNVFKVWSLLCPQDIMSSDLRGKYKLLSKKQRVSPMLASWKYFLHLFGQKKYVFTSHNLGKMHTCDSVLSNGKFRTSAYTWSRQFSWGCDRPAIIALTLKLKWTWAGCSAY